MNKLLKILSSVLLACTLTTGAMAEISIGGTLATAAYYAEGTEVNGGNDATTKGDGAFAHDHGELFVEWNHNDNISFGLSYTPMDIDTPENTNVQNARTNKVSATIQNKTTAYILAKANNGLYAKLGATYADIQSNEQTGSTYPDEETWGATVGLGWQIDAANDVFWRFEVQGSAYEDVSVSNGKAKATGGNKVTFSEMYGAQATISIGKSV